MQRVNKRAAKFQYTASYHRVDLETSPKWKPNKLSVVWTRRSRRVISEPLEWEPTLKDPLKGSVIYNLPENHTVAVTLFKDSRTNELEDKDWTFVLEDVSLTGKRRRLAVCSVNMRKYASLESSQRPLLLRLEPTTHKIVSASLSLTLHCVLLREGQATDEDMQSLVSLLSVNNNSDIAVLEDLDEDDYTLSDDSTRQMLDFRQQMEEMTQSLTNSDLADTPCSVQSLNLDLTPQQAPPDSPTTPVPRDDRLDLKIKIDLPKIDSVTSTPKIDKTEFKPLVLKPRTITKRNLKPLELKTNLNSIGLEKDDENSYDSDQTPTADVDKLLPGRFHRDKTPVQDLLEWCQAVTRDYKTCRVTNLTTSFRSGLAFCAIIHHFRPDLIDLSALAGEGAEAHVRAALEAGAALGIPQVLAVADVCARPAPDRLAIMTYLFQLRAHFTGGELQVEQLGNDETESSYMVGRHDTDESLPPELFSREISTRRSRTDRARPKSEELEDKKNRVEERGSPERGGVRALLGRVLSPQQQPPTWYTDQPLPARPEKLMTRKELTDPFGSDEEDEPGPRGTPEPRSNGKLEAAVEPAPDPPRMEPAATDPLTPPAPPAEPKAETPVAELPKPTPQLLSRHDELKERARQLLEATKREAREKERIRRQNSKEDKELNGVKNGDLSPKKIMTEEERQVMLRERARKLIADAKAGLVSPSSPLSPSRPPRAGAVEIISKQSVLDELAAEDRQSEDAKSTRSNSWGSDEARRSPLQSFTALVDSLSPEDHAADEGKESGSYIQSELEALEREQAAIDLKAAALEKQLRHVMEAADSTEEEDKLMSQWFNLVNKKNALLRRQMQLNILEQEEDLSRRCELLARELRLSLGVDEWRKTPGQKRRERLLLQELLSAVNERDRLVQEMDEQEKAIADDDAIERNLSHVEIQRKNNCILQ